jgi:hypothetical protein
VSAHEAYEHRHEGLIHAEGRGRPTHVHEALQQGQAKVLIPTPTLLSHSTRTGRPGQWNASLQDVALSWLQPTLR